MSAVPPQLALRLDPLIRRLASNFDGERLECVRAIERTLQSGGASFHDLADTLGRAINASTTTSEPETREDEMLAALDGWPTLNQWEQSFVESLRRWRAVGRPLTPKQRDKLQRVFDQRIGRR
jgi:hypothetical protein